jgi:tetratricopeptide (TPR) repeat protein
MIIGAAAVALAVLTSPAHTQSPRDLYVAGKYAEAERAAAAQGTAAGYALAARAELAAETMRVEPCLECLKRAEDFALRAIASDPKLVEGHIEYVIAIGFEARLIGMIDAHFKGYAEKAKEHIDSALAIDPANPWAWAALGNWNIEIAQDGGAALARLIYGATVRNGLADFAKAFSAAPDSLVLHYHYALALAAYDRNLYRNSIGTALARASAGVPHTAYEVYAQKCARDLLTAWRTGDMTAFDRLVRHDQGYP